VNRLGFFCWVLTVGVVIIGVAGCTLERRNGGSDIEESAPPVVPLAQQTAVITDTPIPEPTAVITDTPTPEPTAVITDTPTPEPTAVITDTPTLEPTMEPTTEPTTSPTVIPTPTPASDSIPPGATIGFCYRVQPGETIYSLAQQFDTSPYAINLANDLFPPDLLYAYQTLFIPTELGHGPNIYIIQQGDTLASIAEQCHLPASMIAGVNNLDPGITLQVGAAIDIPIPPFPPPARFNYPTGPLPLVPYPPSCCDAYPPYQPGPPLNN